MATIRTAARALIWRDGCVLVVQYKDDEGFWYVLPGGGQQHGETLHQAVTRECQEEVAIDVIIGETRFVREIIAANHASKHFKSSFHQVEHVFECTIPEDAIPSMGHEPDKPQVGCAWLSPAELATVRFFPQAMVPELVNDLATASTSPSNNGFSYLGDVG